MAKFAALSMGAKVAIVSVVAAGTVGGVAVPVYIHNENLKAVAAMAIVQQQEEESRAASEAAEAERLAAEAEAARIAAEQAEAERKAAEEQAERLAAEEAARLEEEAEAARIAEEQAAAAQAESSILQTAPPADRCLPLFPAPLIYLAFGYPQFFTRHRHTLACCQSQCILFKFLAVLCSHFHTSPCPHFLQGCAVLLR